jgi:hypothetical protein
VKFKFSKGKRPIWSISIYKGSNLFNLEGDKDVKNPVLSAKDITDFTADFVADPFIIKGDSLYYMFFEVVHKYDRKGRIGLATSTDKLNWSYQKIVLEETYHLSYPYVFKYDNNYYMIPECGQSGYIKLYKSEEFPYKWTFMANLLQGDFGDASIFEYHDKFWILSEKKDSGVERNSNLHLYYSNKLSYGWKEHPKSPIIINNFEISRPAGRVIVDNDRIYRFAQQDKPYYGKKISGFEIYNLNEDQYEEKKINCTFEGSNNKEDWNADGMHHIDVFCMDKNNIMACVDGHYFKEYSKITFKAKNIVYKIFTKVKKRLTLNIVN